MTIVKKEELDSEGSPTMARDASSTFMVKESSSSSISTLDFASPILKKDVGEANPNPHDVGFDWWKAFCNSGPWSSTSPALAEGPAASPSSPEVEPLPPQAQGISKAAKAKKGPRKTNRMRIGRRRGTVRGREGGEGKRERERERKKK